ncbi:hypothetical protein [Dietzia psychralcaliphila]|uniref:DUF4157 domain-containing protein n=1 Tax=Dietzia psychralcaliphila TaxID=139021 RepID=A0AAD0NQY4_9ACTN|nr:hypothetical protein [Dietzia psychralcaliphila]AWH95488.1 hypothetical protein A6048_08250 [Dietzia psychralcaliphila]PTM88776.1 hypothetical protein C8N39_103379 [Dietzia psychralcaliphila]
MRTIAGRAADTLGRLIAVTARALDRGLDGLGVVPPALDLPPDVRDDLRVFFGPTIDPAAVMIRRGHVPGVPHPRAFALPGLIYLGADPGVVGTAAEGIDRPRATSTLVHELVHVWQGRVIGPRYVVVALAEQARMGRRAYDWRAVLDNAVFDNAVLDNAVLDGAALDRSSEARASQDRASHDRAHIERTKRAFPVEAHAQLVSDAYALRFGFTPVTASATPSRELQAMEEALTGLRAGRAPTLRGRAV